VDVVFETTKDLRPNELGKYKKWFYIKDFGIKIHYKIGVLTLGTSPDGLGIAIPPGSENFTVNSYCFNSCLSDVIKDFEDFLL